MAEALADRLAEAFAEKLHELVRRQLWGYAPDEALSVDDMLKVKYQVRARACLCGVWGRVVACCRDHAARRPCPWPWWQRAARLNAALALTAPPRPPPPPSTHPPTHAHAHAHAHAHRAFAPRPATPASPTTRRS
jgi:hypothetical protein